MRIFDIQGMNCTGCYCINSDSSETSRDQATANLAMGIREALLIADMNRHVMLGISFGYIYFGTDVLFSHRPYLNTYLILCVKPIVCTS